MGQQAEIPASATPAARSRTGRLACVWLLTGLVAAAVALLAWQQRDAGSPPAVLHLPWWTLLAAFLLTETCVVHLHFRRSAHSFTLGEIPLLLGLLFADPLAIMAAWGLAGAVVLAANRTPLQRLVFNVFLLALTAGLAGAVFGVLAPSGAVTDHGVWGAALTGALASALAGALLIALAVSVAESRVPAKRLAQMVAAAMAVAATNASLGLAVAVVLEADARAALLLLAPAGVVFAAYRAYVSERHKHASLELLYEVSRTLGAAPDTASALAGVLARVNSAFRSEVAEAYVFETAAGHPARTTLGPGDRIEVMQPVSADLQHALQGLLAPGRGGQILLPTTPGAEPLRAHLAARGIQDAMLAPLVGERELVGALVLGASGRVGGSFSADELRLLETLARHTGATIEKGQLGRQIGELRQLQGRLEHQAFHDPLTGLANRLLFHDRVAHALARRSGNVAVMYIDLDDFKSVNDTLGHDAGDALLVQTAARLKQALRPSDTPARLGGDEFAVLLVDISEDNARLVAERILGALRRPVSVQDREIPVHASLGIALSDSGALSAEDLLSNADAAMYAAKHGGKRGLTVFEAQTAVADPAPLAVLA